MWKKNLEINEETTEIKMMFQFELREERRLSLKLYWKISNYSRNVKT